MLDINYKEDKRWLDSFFIIETDNTEKLAHLNRHVDQWNKGENI